MPSIQIEGPFIKDLDKKRELIREMTDAAVNVKAYGLPEEVIVVLIKQNAPENVGVGGSLLADRMADS